MREPARAPLGLRSAGTLFVDATALSLAVVAASLAAGRDASSSERAILLAACSAALLLTLAVAGAYRVEAARSVSRSAILRLVVVGAGALVVLLGWRAFSVPAVWVRAGLLYHAVASLTLPGAWMLYRWLLRHPSLESRILVVGSGPLAASIARGIAARRPFGLRVAGHVAEVPGCDSTLEPWLGRPCDLDKVLNEFAIDRVVVADGKRDPSVEDEAMIQARLGGLDVESGSTCFEWLYERLPLEATGRELFLEPPGFTPGRAFECAKRAFDVLVAASGLLLVLPLFGLAALAIKLDSPGPVLYHQIRLGRGQRHFRLWKLRTMGDDAERVSGPTFSDANDGRVTRVGRLLRRSRVDEIPQLWNVLCGDMSLVGPRPERPELFDAIAEHHPLFRHRTAIRPGITGWAQVRQGYVSEHEGFGLKLSYDLFYLKRRSLWFDLRVIARTASEFVQLKGV